MKCFTILLLLATISAVAKSDESSSTITVTLIANKWTSSRLAVQIAYQIMTNNNVADTNIVEEAGNQHTYADLAAGTYDAALEIWPSSLSELQEGLVLSGAVVELGLLGVVGQIGWFVPNYVVEEYPELATWEGYTTEEAAALFATSSSGAKGRFLEIDPSYSTLDAQIIDNLNLPFVIETAGSEEEAIAILDAAVAAREPILMYWWLPTATAIQYNLTRVELPPVTDECRAVIDKDDGSYNCDYPKDYLLKVASGKLEAKSPRAFSFLKAFQLTMEDQLSMLPRVEFGDESVEGVAKDWVESNEEVWSEWLVYSQKPTEPPASSSGFASSTFGTITSLLVLFTSFWMIK